MSNESRPARGGSRDVGHDVRRQSNREPVNRCVLCAADAREDLAQASAAVKTRRIRVLAHDDLAARLTRPPLSYTKPGQWNGYVPPALDACGRRNNSPRRAALVEIAAEAWHRDEGGEA